ncbi:MAG TPA: biotin--[acetyl-CoA-carboxylase] ligase [Terriglobales bacterium]|nr:biotin--[acetyl-CoA-carboxylase] ligase [Terriglobales bacterium]
MAALYRECAVIDAALGKLLKGTIFAGRVYCFASIDSTNSALLQDAALKDASGSGLPEGTVYIADEQTAGRGRGGHTWHSPPGVGLYLSALLRPHLPAEDVLGITLAAGIAAAEAIAQVAEVECDVRWPNDLLLQGKKTGGILTEMNSSNRGMVVVGFGINVNHSTLPAELQETATSLLLAKAALTGGVSSKPLRIDTVALAVALLQFFDREYRHLAQAGLPALLARFERHSSYARGKHVVVGEEGGYEGITDGLDERGFLRVKTANGMRIVLSGTVRAKQHQGDKTDS